MNGNTSLHLARTVKNDEFFTRLEDIEKELSHYDFHGKIVYCNCDSEDSGFLKYFRDNYKSLGLRGLLSSDCDFRSDESISLLKEADIVSTNPPFSLFREYVAQLVEHDKKFLIIGNKNAITYKEVFKLIKDSKLWLGHTSPGNFIKSDGTMANLAGLTKWFTNLPTKRRTEELELLEKYDPKKHPKYDNYDAIEVGSTLGIPVDYKGVMGVPITFLEKCNPEQFEIIGLLADKREIADGLLQGIPTYLDEGHKKYVGAILNGKATYSRIIIKHKKHI